MTARNLIQLLEHLEAEYGDWKIVFHCYDCEQINRTYPAPVELMSCYEVERAEADVTESVIVLNP